MQKKLIKTAIAVMKLSAVPVLVFLSFFSALAKDLEGQEILTKRITISVKSEKLNNVLKEVSNKTGAVFFYSPEVIRAERKVSTEARGIELAEFLDSLLTPLNIKKRVDENGNIFLNKTDGKIQEVAPANEDIFRAPPPRVITGKVTTTDGTAIEGATVQIKGSESGTATDKVGSFILTVGDNDAVLVISAVGFEKKEVAVTSASGYAITMAMSTNNLNDVVVVGYGTQKKQTVTGSIASVKGEQLTAAPMASTANTLAGRLPGLISLQSSGQPGSDAAALSIRGFGAALTIVDGVEADFNTIDANSIESISILKDGAASIYGARAGNGVILVTTKRGINDKPVITLNSSATAQGITSMPKMVSAGQYAELQSETWLQSGQPPANVPYTEAQIQKYYDGTDPLYPNTDWYKELIRDWAPQQQHNLSVRGGNDKIKYYGFIGYLDQGTMWKKNGGNYNRFNLQSNIDAKITEELSLQLDLANIYEVRRFPWRGEGAGGNTVWQDFWNTMPIYPATLPDPTKISFANGGGTGGAHVMTNSDLSGYNNNDIQTIKGNLILNYKLKAVKGLSAKALVNIIQTYNSNKYFSKPVKFYTYDPASDIYTLAGALGSQASLQVYKGQGRVITGQFSLGYDKVFAGNHHIGALALYEVIDYFNDFVSGNRINFLSPSIDQLFGGSTTGMSNYGAATEMGRKSVVGRLNYDFKNKYILEASVRADASAKFPKENRWGYFPSVSVGWVLSKENFMSGLNNLDNLKIRASYGESGNDAVGNFQYLSGYAYGNTYILGTTAQPGLISTGLANPLLTWEKVQIKNVGLDFSLWQRKLYGEIDAFYRIRDGIPATKIATLPSTFGSALPPENLNSLNDRGFDLRLGTSGHTREFSWDISGTISWSRAKWDHFEEAKYTDSNQARLYTNSGKWTDRGIGYISDGLFTSQKEIDALGFNQDGQNNASLRPGDIRFKDLNNDGVLDWKDQQQIGNGNSPHWMLGLNTNLKYKDFDFSALFQGAMGYNNYISLQHGLVQPVQIYDLRWTDENNNPNALVPRLGGAGTNSLQSDFYYKKAGYVRLKVVSIGYTLPTRLLNKINFKQVRLYAAGTNILTFDRLKDYGTDPEAPSGASGFYYPQQKTFTVGLNLSL